MEFWKDVIGYEGMYQVSNLGNVRSLTRNVERTNPWNKNIKTLYTYRGKEIPFWITKKGYKRLTLNKNGVKKNYMVHRLVAMAWIDNPENKEQVNHKNLDKKDNKVDNLEWCTNLENYIHSVKNGKQRFTYDEYRKC